MFDSDDREELLTWLNGLVVGCPFNDPLDDCPLLEIRKLPLAERYKLIKLMSEDEIRAILNHHKDCLERREN